MSPCLDVGRAVRTFGAESLHAMCYSKADLPLCPAESRYEKPRGWPLRIATTALLHRYRHKPRHHRRCSEIRLQGSYSHPFRSWGAAIQLKPCPFVLNAPEGSTIGFRSRPRLELLRVSSVFSP